MVLAAKVLFENINPGFLHNIFAGGGIKKAGLIAEPFHIVPDIFVVAHPYSANFRVMSADIFKKPFQPELEGITILNLWHGVGCKSIERKVTGGFLQERIAKKI